MTISRHTASLIIDGSRYEPTDLVVTLDEDAVPFANLSATVPLDGTTGADLDPRTIRMVRASLRQDFGDADTLGTLSEQYTGDVIADVVMNELVVPEFTFEDGVGDWAGSTSDVYGSEGELVWSAEHARSGEHSVELVYTGNPDPDAGFPAMVSPVMPVNPDLAYVVAAWLYGTTDYAEQTLGAEEILITHVLDDGSTSSSYWGELFGMPAGEWHRITAVAPAPADPNVVGVQVAIRSQFYTADNDRRWIDDVTLAVSRGTLNDLTNRYGKPYNHYGMRPSTTRNANLWLRSRDVDHGAGTVTIVAASGEAMLSDYALAETSPMVPGGSTVRDAVNMVLGHVLHVGLTDSGTGDEVVETEALPWGPGESAWSYLTSITGSAGLRLWCDEVGLWHLENPETYIARGGVSMGPDRAVTLEDSVNRESNGWATSAVVTYQWEDANGERRTRHDAFGPGGSRTITRTEERPYPGRGFAQAIARKALALGRVVRISAVSDYDVQPLQPAVLTLPDAPDHAGTVAAVQWSLPADQMTVRTRDLMGIGPHSWLRTSPGRSWDDTPAGISWTEYDWSAL